MAVDPERIEEIIRATANLYRAAEHGLLQQVTRRLGGQLDSPGWAQTRLAAVGALRTATRGVLRRLRTSTDPAVHQAVTDAYQAGSDSVLTDLGQDAATVRAAARDAAKTVTRPKAIRALATALVDDLGARHSNVVRDVVDDYRKVIAEATAASIAGGMNRRDAAQLAYARLVDRGLTSFTDRAGRRWRLSSYVEMAIRTVTQRAAVQGQIDKQERMGLPFVMVSNEAQECVLCRPYEGKVLRIGDGPTGRITVPHQITGAPVQITVKATLADARLAGFQHPNCRHSVRAYLPGVTKLPEPSTADPAGDEARQRQRAIERHIRRWKERELAALTPQAAAQARARVRAWQGRMREHLAANPDLKRLAYREQIGGGNVPAAVKSAVKEGTG